MLSGDTHRPGPTSFSSSLPIKIYQRRAGKFCPPARSCCTGTCPAGYWSRGPMSCLLFAFVDPKDPFTAGELADEPLPGPLLSILAARPFTDAFLFHTPQT